MSILDPIVPVAGMQDDTGPTLASERIKASERPAAMIAQRRRIAVKVGSSLLVDDGGVIKRRWLSSLGKDGGHREYKRQVLIISSGTVAPGRTRLFAKSSSRLLPKQGGAASGQPLLMRAWDETLAPFGIPIARLVQPLDGTGSRWRSVIN